jgi:hypothetical protein
MIGAVVFGAAASLAAGAIPVNAMPLDGRIAAAPNPWLEKAQVVVVGPGPRRRPPRRVRRCWWSRGRRVCGWRWV